MATRFLNKQIAILSENVKVRFKATGGVYFVDENGDETKRYVLGKKARQDTDEVKRELSEKARYKGFEVSVIPQSLPITINYLTNTSGGGVVNPSYNVSNMPSDKLTIVSDYILKSIWATIRVNQFEVWRALADTKADKLDMPAVYTAKDELAIELVQDRTNSSFIYDAYFVEAFPNGTIYDSTNNTINTPEILVENLDLDAGDVLDLDVDIKINFFGELDFQVLNS